MTWALFLLLLDAKWHGVLARGLIAVPTARYVALTWDHAAASTATSYRVYKAAGNCAAAGDFARIADDAPASGYQDYAVSAGALFCYYVTAVAGESESEPSNRVDAVIPN